MFCWPRRIYGAELGRLRGFDRSRLQTYQAPHRRFYGEEKTNDLRCVAHSLVVCDREMPKKLRASGHYVVGSDTEEQFSDPKIGFRFKKISHGDQKFVSGDMSETNFVLSKIIQK